MDAIREMEFTANVQVKDEDAWADAGVARQISVLADDWDRECVD